MIDESDDIIEHTRGDGTFRPLTPEEVQPYASTTFYMVVWPTHVIIAVAILFALGRFWGFGLGSALLICLVYFFVGAYLIDRYGRRLVKKKEGIVQGGKRP